MNANRWQRIEQLYHEARALAHDARSSFLADATGGDEALRREVESLLAHGASTPGFLDSQGEPPRRFPDDPSLSRPRSSPTQLDALSGASGSDEDATVPPPPEQARLGVYRLDGRIGSGGMGEVFRAVDTRLARPVAIKIVSRQFGARFDREARAIAALNHPHICTLYDVGPDYLVMELIDGQTLADRIGHGPLPLDEVVRYGAQIADALAEAHAHGIVHRDLKPGNVMLSRNSVKVLDFGLATFTGAPRSTLTHAGVVMGTPAYMAPEQAHGTDAGAATDLFALGLVLYEMVTGRPPVRGASLGSILADGLSVTIDSPCKGRSPRASRLNALILGLLERDPAHRPHSAALVRETLLALRHASRLVSPIVAAALVSGVVLTGGAVWWSYRTGQPTPSWPPVSSVSTITSSPGDEVNPAVSPDGVQLAFAGRGPDGGRQSIYLTGIDGQQEPRRLTDDTAQDTADDFAAWSPDGRQIAFVRRHGATEAAIIIVPAQGGAERMLRQIHVVQVSNPHSWLSWRPDGSELAFAAESGDSGRSTLFMLRIADGRLRTLFTPPEGVTGDASPAIAPDGRSLAFVRYLSPGTSALLVQRLDADANAMGRPTPIPGAGVNARTAIWADERRLLIAENGRILEWHAGAPATPVYVSSAGLQGLAFAGRDRRGAARVIAAQGIAAPNHLWMIPLGSAGQATERPELQSSFGSGIANPDFSSDGTHVAFTSARSGTPEIWMADADGRNLRQLTQLVTGRVGIPHWSPDGRYVAFYARLPDEPQIYVIDVTQEHPTPRQMTHQVPGCNIPSWSRDGRYLYCSRRIGGELRLYRVPTNNSDTSDQGIERWFEGKDARETPDGRLIYLKDGVPGIFVRSLAGDPTTNPEERLVSDIIGPIAYYALAPSGIYYTGQNNLGQYVGLHFFDRDKHRIIEVASRAVTGRMDGLTVSPDGRLLLYTQTSQAGTDLTLIRFQ